MPGSEKTTRFFGGPQGQRRWEGDIIAHWTPKNGGLEIDFPVSIGWFSGSMLFFLGVLFWYTFGLSTFLGSGIPTNINFHLPQKTGNGDNMQVKKKKSLTFHYYGCLIGIHKWVVFHPLLIPNKQPGILFIAHVSFAESLAECLRPLCLLFHKLFVHKLFV